MNKIVTCYVPFKNFNLYSTNICNFIKKAGYEVLPIKEILLNPLYFFRCRIFNFNWFEEAVSRKEYYKKRLLLILLKLFRKKIVFTVHNKFPHETGEGIWSYKLTKSMCKMADAIIGLCPDTFQLITDIAPNEISKLNIVPHPNYVQNYIADEQQDYRNKFGFDNEDLVFLFIGGISPYKNVELLIDIFERISAPHVKLLITGDPYSKSYGESLKKRLETSKNIKFDFRLIPDDEIASFYQTCDIVVLPYNKSSYLNSGAVYLSFSLKRTVICPLIGSIKMIDNKSFIYDYDYENEDNHANELEKCILQVCEEYQKEKSILSYKGKEAYDYVLKNHSDNLVYESYKKIYDGLISE